MPYFHNYRPGEGFPGWAYPDIIEPILELTAEPGFQVDIFNASHDPALDHWPAFGGYATLFDPRRVHYHPRIPLAEVQARLPEYDYGMFLFAPSTVVVDYPLQQSLPNRCMSYLAGDLPLIVNTEMRHLAGLVDHFSAGLTISCQDLPSLATRLRLADHSALRSGAAALHRHLVAANRATLDALSRGLAQKVDRIGQT
jgi:hypothetical protein